MVKAMTFGEVLACAENTELLTEHNFYIARLSVMALLLI